MRNKTPTYLRPIRIGLALGLILLSLDSYKFMGLFFTLGCNVIIVTLILFVEESDKEEP